MTAENPYEPPLQARLVEPPKRKRPPEFWTDLFIVTGITAFGLMVLVASWSRIVRFFVSLFTE